MQLAIKTDLAPGTSSVDFVSALLEDTGVSLTPGTVFGQYGEGYVRLSLTVPEQKIKLAFDKIENWMENAPAFLDRR